MSRLSAHGLSFSRGPAGQRQPILQDLDLELSQGETLVVLGPSGCGKTTLLHILAGLQAPDRGEVRIDGRPSTAADGLRSVVFQEHALLPWLNAADNLGLGLRLRGLNRRQRQQHTEAWLARVGLEGLGRRRIDALSGGQRQRLGLARALAIAPRFLLLDEPFAALDAHSRERMQDLLLQLAQASQPGLFLITHSVEEALLLASELWLLQGPPLTIGQRLQLPYARRLAAGETRAALRAEAEFIALQEQLRHSQHPLDASGHD